MAEKKKTGKSTSSSKSTKKIKKKVVKEVKKQAKKNPKAFAAFTIAIVILLIVAISLVMIIKPDLILNLLGSPNTGEVSTPTTDGELTMHVINVGQGDCILICFPDGKDMVIDCGNKSSGYNYNSTKEYLDTYVTDNQLDYLMLTHGDEDHVGFLDNIIDAYQVDNIYMPNIKAEPTNAEKLAQVNALEKEKLDMFTDNDTLSSAKYAEFFIAALTEPNCNIVLNIGTFTIFGEGWKIDFFCLTQEQWDNEHLNNAHQKNMVSPIGILQCNGKRIVLTGDSNEENEPLAMQAMKDFYKVDKLDCDVLKVGHHGSESSSTVGFLDFLTCESAIISCDAHGNNYYHPRYNTLVRFINRDMNVYRTDLHGNIVIKITSTNLTITSQTNANEDEIWKGYTTNSADSLRQAMKGDSEI